MWRTVPDMTDSWRSFLATLEKQFNLTKFAGAFGWNDPGFLRVGCGGMTYQEYEAQFVLWSVLKAPLILGCSLDSLSL